jgi:hypothetical protein
MTARQLRMALKRLGTSQRGMARILGINERSMRGYVSLADERRIPEPIAVLISLLADGKITVADIEERRR